MDSTTMTAAERAAEIERIRAGMLKKDYYIMHRRPLASERKSGAILEHFQWLVRLEKEGHILLTGGIFKRDGTQSEGLTILRAGSWEAAETLAASDPLVTAGAVTHYLERIRIGAGRVAICVDFTDQTMRFD
jgi:uncharacterized protein